jgi:hypothetical protein
MMTEGLEQLRLARQRVHGQSRARPKSSAERVRIVRGLASKERS